MAEYKSTINLTECFMSYQLSLRWKLVICFAVLFGFSMTPASAGDWIHWRGPEQNGHSLEKNLPGEFDPDAGKKGNIIWKEPYGGRSAPLVMAGKLFLIQGTGEGIHEGEQIVCLDEKTGMKQWEYRVNVFHTDIVSARLGWTTLTADPATGYIYAHTTGGDFLCLDSSGKLIWSRQLTEEFGRVTGYGGRIVSPIFDSGLAIIGMVNGSWGDMARGLNRFVAFDGKTGAVVWWTTLGQELLGTYYSSPVIAVINGQRLLITGAADGGLHAIKVRTGENVWNYTFSKGIINGSPVVDGNLVICSHGEENPEGNPIGRVICVDGSQVDPVTKKPKLVWDTFRRKYKANRNQELANRFGLASAALANGLLYVPDDTGELFCFRAKDGEMLWKYRYATEVRGAPLVADGKLYIFDVKGRMLILTLQGEKRPDEADTFEYKFRDPKGLLNETNGTPIAVNGHVYFTTRTHIYCIGDPNAKHEEVKYPPLPPETPFKQGAAASVRIFPADVSVKPGSTVSFTVVFMDENGREVALNQANATWTLPTPPVPKGATTGPPPLNGKIENGNLSLAPLPGQQGYVDFAFATYKARARVRVVPQIPYTQDFSKIPAGATPGGWVNVTGKYLVKKLEGDISVLSKLNTDSRPPLARANAYITGPDASDYTIQADLMGTEVRGKMPDMGIVNCRYTLIMAGTIDPNSNQRQLRIQSWDGKRRVDVGQDFNWEPGAWYTAKLTVEPKEKSALLRAKVWKKGDKEPEKWTLEFEDPNPNRNGAAALYGYVSNVTTLDDGTVQPGSSIYYAHLSITPNTKK
jgi:outer membrane protein assembly factor BamB